MRTAFVAAAAVMLFAAPVQSQEPAVSPVRAERVEEADGSVTLAHEVEVGAPVAEVWTAISTCEGWMRWAVPIAWLDPDDPDVFESSYDPQAAYGAPQNIRQRFLIRVPNRLLAFQTIQAPAGFADAERFAGVRTVFELAPLGASRTRVRLTGAGYPGDAAGQRLLAFFDQGNAATLNSLKTALEAPTARED
ncbi:SRPBCC domain-containing protein [Brevundimonas faecalis]|uniref:SRPBCC family protein n=1 Tax=Brevundimonas faecalis TaxID=947378 RepID=UPI00360FB60A